MNDDAHQPTIQCDACHTPFRADQIHCLPKPLLFGDHFLRYRCGTCTQAREEYSRDNMSWVAVVHLVIYNLIRRQSILDKDKPDSEKRHKYYRWKDDICAFIDDYWDYFVPGKQRSPTWHNTIASVLSTHGTIFKSGYEIFHQSAWWTLFEEAPPTKENKPRISKAKGTQKRSQHENQGGKSKKQRAEQRDTRKRTTKGSSHPDKIKKEQQSASDSDFRDKEAPIEEMADMFDLGSLSDLSSDPGMLSDEELQVPKQQEPIQPMKEAVDPTHTEISPLPPPLSPTEATSSAAPMSQTQDMHPIDYTPQHQVQVKQEPESISMLFSSTHETSNLAKVEAVDKKGETTSCVRTSPKPQLQPAVMTPQMEWQMLQQLGNASKKLPTVAARFERKLAVRRLKRNLGIRLFDIDVSVNKQLRSRSELEPITKPFDNASKEDAETTNQPSMTPAAASFDAITYTPYQCSFASRLYGPIRHDSVVTRDEPWLSAWNGRKLRPYIRRDFESTTPYMQTLTQIRSRNGSGQEKERHSIDYVYFQPQHLDQVNAMLRRCFWDGIDVSESLLFPEFSIVALYKRLVVGCAFMTPEAYVTYFAVLPGWNNAGIGQFMLYHLFQTAISKDITLHVSANNNAMILYQKFGFKPEEFIVDFYDKYLPADSTYSKNAFFLRLRR